MSSISEKKILVTGANGQLGRSLRRLFSQIPDANVTFTDIDSLDITDREAVNSLFSRESFTHVVNCAAFTKVEKAESESIEAARLNTEAVGIIAQAAARHNAKVLHISTDYVFSGDSSRPYNENDEPYPRTIYGRTKFEGEGILTAFLPDSIIVRTSWLYSEFGNNFVEKILSLASEQDTLRVVSDQIGTPTYAGDLAAAIIAILDADEWKKGIYHFSNEGVASWYDFAKAILHFAGKDAEVDVIPISSREYSSGVARPLYSVLNKEKIKKNYMLVIPHWADSLKKCISKTPAI